MRVDDRPTLAAPDDDPYLWLEEVEGGRALDFVEQQNRKTLQQFGGAQFAADRDMLAAIYDRPDNIPYVSAARRILYNLWKDAEQSRAASGGERRSKSFASQIRNGKCCWTSTGSPPKKSQDWLWSWTADAAGKRTRGRS